MQFGSYLASFLLHAMLLLLVLLWPSKPKVDLSQAVQISLVDGAPGGEMMPSPVLGRQGDPGANAKADARPVPEARPLEQLPPPPPPAAAQAEAKNVPEPQKAVTEIPRPESVVKSVTPPPPADDVKLLSEKKVEKKPDPEPEQKAETKRQTTPPPPQKQAETKKAEPSREDALKAALADAQKSAKPETGSSSNSRQDAVARALADARRQSRRQGTGGGGGGEGDGPGGGGITDVYAGLVIMAVQPNWSTSTFASRQNIVVKVRIKLDRSGNVLDCFVEESSGNPAFDGSAVNAVKRTRILPPPPTPDMQDFVIAFNSQDAMR